MRCGRLGRIRCWRRRRGRRGCWQRAVLKTQLNANRQAQIRVNAEPQWGCDRFKTRGRLDLAEFVAAFRQVCDPDQSVGIADVGIADLAGQGHILPGCGELPEFKDRASQCFAAWVNFQQFDITNDRDGFVHDFNRLVRRNNTTSHLGELDQDRFSHQKISGSAFDLLKEIAAFDAGRETSACRAHDDLTQIDLDRCLAAIFVQLVYARHLIDRAQDIDDIAILIIGQGYIGDDHGVFGWLSKSADRAQ